MKPLAISRHPTATARAEAEPREPGLEAARTSPHELRDWLET